MAHNFHSNATALVIAAAKKSGLLDSVAEALRFFDKTPNEIDCPACELLSELAGAFDEHVLLPHATVESFHGEGVEIPQYSEEGLRSYFHVPFEVHVETAPPRFSINFDKLYDAEKAVIEAARAEMMRQIKAERGSASPA